jgi:hypothetical protein
MATMARGTGLPKAAKPATVNSTILGAAAEHYVMWSSVKNSEAIDLLL